MQRRDRNKIDSARATETGVGVAAIYSRLPLSKKIKIQLLLSTDRNPPLHYKEEHWTGFTFVSLWA